MVFSIAAARANGVILTPVTAEENGNPAIGSKQINDCFEDLYLYRWDKMTGDNYPKDSEWHPMLIFEKTNTAAVYPFYIGPAGTKDVILGSSHGTIEGAKWSGRDGNIDLESWVSRNSFNDIVKQDKTAFLEHHDRYDDKTVQPEKDYFFTKSDKNCMYIKYSDLYENSPRYDIRLSDGKGWMSDLWLNLCVSKEGGWFEGYHWEGYLEIIKGGRSSSGGGNDPSIF